MTCQQLFYFTVKLFFVEFFRSFTSIFLKKTGEPEIEEIKVKTSIGLYSQEVDTVAYNLQSKQAKEMSWQDTLDNSETLKLWRDQVGLPPFSDSYE